MTWSHYKLLIPMKEPQERLWYEDLAEKEGLKRPAEATYLYKAIVDRVIDGDTLLLRIDLGFQVLKEQRVRLAFIDTPSIDEPSDLKGAVPFKLKVDFVMVKTNKIDIYGRYIGHVFYSSKAKNKSAIFAKGKYLNQELINKGLARII